MTRNDALAISFAFGLPLAGPKLLSWLMQCAFKMLEWATRRRRFVRADADRVTYRGRSIELAKLASVRVMTTADGPFLPDVFWVLAGADGARLIIPQEASGSQGLLDRLQSLPMFDNEAVLQAMVCTDAGEFVCWQSNPAP